jgi:hypothetical protein
MENALAIVLCDIFQKLLSSTVSLAHGDRPCEYPGDERHGYLRI